MKLPLFTIKSEDQRKIALVNELLGYGLVRNPSPTIDSLGFVLPTSKGVLDLKRGKFTPRTEAAR